jgi:hypothetical protein
MTVIMSERKECRECKWFSQRLTWWEMLPIEPEQRRDIIGKCFRPRDNWQTYPIKKVKNPKSCRFFEKGKER